MALEHHSRDGRWEEEAHLSSTPTNSTRKVFITVNSEIFILTTIMKTNSDSLFKVGFFLLRARFRGRGLTQPVENSEKAVLRVRGYLQFSSKLRCPLPSALVLPALQTTWR